MTEKLENISKVSAHEFVSSALSFYHKTGLSFALWKLPGSSALFLAASEQPQPWSEVNLEEAKPGFLFSPFQPAQKKIYLPADELFTFDSGYLTSSQGHQLFEVNRHTPGKENNAKPTPYYVSHRRSASPMVEKYFQQLVTQCREEVLRGSFEKIVPSRSKTVALDIGFDLISAFDRLCHLYPQAMVSVFSSPLTGTWVGASPEMLVSVSKDQRFHTAAVAGTQAFEEGVDLRSVTWTQKDIEEQALVERYIISCFKKIRLREFEEHGPKTVVAGNILHLKTDFEVDMVATNFPQLGSVMLQLLHPTSAVCGMPLEPSLAFLKVHEGYDRQFYSGYLGPLNVGEESHLYVNLRCMQLFAHEAILYAGAGVLADSDPEKEWNETELKMNTLLRIIER